jgi:hypothetical protein
MEQVIFLHTDDEPWAVLHHVQQSTAQHLILVLPLSLDRLRLSMLLRLIRRSTALQGQQLSVVSEDLLVRMLAERMGCTVSATLDEHDGLAPGRVSPGRKRALRGRKILWFASRTQHHLAQTQSAPKPEPPAKALSTSSDLSPRERPYEYKPAEEPPGQRRRPLSVGSQASDSQGTAGKPRANLEAILVDGYLPNPAATPGLDEEEERTAGEEAQRFHYEISDDTRPSQAQQAAEDHEARLTARIRETSAPGTSAASANPPVPVQDEQATSGAPPDSGPAEASERDLADAAFNETLLETPGEEASADKDKEASALTPPSSEMLSLQVPRPAPSEPASPTQSTGRRLRRMRSIDELLQERGRESPLDWFEE